MHLFSAYLVGRTFSSIPGALPSLGTAPPPPSSHLVESALTGHGVRQSASVVVVRGGAALSVYSAAT